MTTLLMHKLADFPVQCFEAPTLPHLHPLLHARHNDRPVRQQNDKEQLSQRPLNRVRKASPFSRSSGVLQFVQQASSNASEHNRKAERNSTLSQNFGAALKARALPGHWPVAVSSAFRKTSMCLTFRRGVGPVVGNQDWRCDFGLIDQRIALRPNSKV
jgi:hypothetical protein